MTSVETNRCVVYENSFGRWVLLNEQDSKLAWSGSRWVPHVDGFPTGAVQVCNFDTDDQARVYAHAHELEVIDEL